MRKRCAIETAMVLLALAGVARATSVLPVDITELSRDARVIVVGRVVSLDARWTDDRRAINTLVTLSAETYLKGDLGPAPQFLVPGGQLGRLRHVVIGAPEFGIDERVVVFLGVRGPSLPFVLGLSQGVSRLMRTSAGWLVTPPIGGPIAGRPTPIVRGDLSRKPVPLADFEQRVRALAAGAR